MIQIEFFLGTGLREPCAPYREAHVYGAPYGSVNAYGWNCLPDIMGEPDEFSLDPLAPDSEVCVALVRLRNATGGRYQVKLSWFDNALARIIKEEITSLDMAPGASVYLYSTLAWVSWEISDPGSYRALVEVSGADAAGGRLDFAVTQAGPQPPPPPVDTGGLEVVVQGLQGASNWFYQAYLTTYAWIWPFWLLSAPLYQLSVLNMAMAGGLANFSTWVSDLAARIAAALSWDSIKALILDWLGPIVQTVAWYTNWWNLVLYPVREWWGWVQDFVHGWIAVATAGLESLRAGWLYFISEELPNLVSFGWLTDWWNSRVTDVQGLIDSAFAVREDLWAGWNQWRESVAELFRDPEAWLYDKVESMIARFW